MLQAEMADFTPIHFFDAPIEVIFITLPSREKTPDCPDGFIWEEKTYRVIETLSEWSDFTRRGKFARNMRPAHAAVASYARIVECGTILLSGQGGYRSNL